MRYKKNSGGVDPRLSEPDIYIIDPETGERRVMRGVEAANYAVVLQGLMAEDPINYDKERTRASLTWHINHAMRMGYPWDELKVRLSKAKKGERSNPRGRRRNPDEPKWLSDARKRKKETGDPGEWFISLHDEDSGYTAHGDFFTGTREQAKKKAAYYADDLIDANRPGFNVKAYVYDPTTESPRPAFVVAPSRARVTAKDKARRLHEAMMHGDWDEHHRIRTGRSVKGRRAKKNPVAKYYKVPISNFTVMTLPEVGMTFESDGWSIHLARSALPKWKPGKVQRGPLRAPRSYLPAGRWRVIRGGPSSSPLWVQRAEIPYKHRE